MAIPSGYDPTTLNHWLWYKYQCHEGSANEFQRLFENIIKRAKPEFMQIRPYGRIGDRKSDGMFVSSSGSTIFQVYSPDELKQAEVEKKINEDLDGAYEHWKMTLKTWVFVYNVRRGLPPDIPSTLLAKQKEYPDITLEHLSSDGLWEMARTLTLQQRVEVLGAPSGYEQLFIASSPGPDELQHLYKDSRLVLIQDTLMTIDKASAISALLPDAPFGFPIIIRPALDQLSFTESAIYQKQIISEALERSRDISFSRFAVFSLAPIPLAIHLGFLLSDGVQVQHFQYDRDALSWSWPIAGEKQVNYKIHYKGIPEQTLEEPVDVLIRISLSATVAKQQTDRSISNVPVEIDMWVDDPDVQWLIEPKQLTELAKAFRTVLNHIRNKVPNCSRIHLFCAMPTGACVIIGQCINPRMNPPVDLYEFSRQAKKPYTWALTLQD